MTKFEEAVKKQEMIRALNKEIAEKKSQIMKLEGELIFDRNSLSEKELHELVVRNLNAYLRE